ncbi:MAG: hypothetical protein N4R78_01375 [Lactobacillus iners]|nr:hypothetical protein [Lactobacillus iners]
MDTELEQQQPGYYSILSASVRYDKDLNANEKILFSEITALSNKYGYCLKELITQIRRIPWK